MAKWPDTPVYTPIANINKGNEYQEADGLTAADMNAIVENIAYLYGSESGFVKKTDTEDLVKGRIYLGANVALTIEEHSQYIIECFDSSDNLQKMTAIGGKTQEGTIAILTTGGRLSNGRIDSLLLMITGSIIISNLAVTDANITTIKPSNSAHHLVYFKMSGKAFMADGGGSSVAGVSSIDNQTGDLTTKTLFGNKSLLGTGNIDLYNHDIQISNATLTCVCHVGKTSSSNLKVDSLTDLKTLFNFGTYFSIYDRVKGTIVIDGTRYEVAYVSNSGIGYYTGITSISFVSWSDVTITDTVTTV